MSFVGALSAMTMALDVSVVKGNDVPDVTKLVSGWLRHFAQADAQIKWIDAECEVEYWLTHNTVLMGRIDAIGRTQQGELFFGEWKTANPRERSSWKEQWCTNPQSLTYGLLMTQLNEGEPCSRFTVRKAFKSDPPSYDHAWLSYSEDEIDRWKRQVIAIAEDIRQDFNVYGRGPWQQNWKHCLRYGPKYKCTFYGRCTTGVAPAGVMTRVSHLDAERRLYAADKLAEGMVVLDATRIVEWLECREKFRSQYIEDLMAPAGEVLQIGIDFHEALGKHYTAQVK